MSGPSAASSPAASREVTLRPAMLDDYPRISALECRYGLGSRTYQEWSHLWVENPVYRERQSEWCIGWVIEDRSRGIVASIGNIPLAYEFDRKRLFAASARSWVAEPEYRGISLQLLDRVVNQPGIDLYFNTTVGANAVANVGAFECERVPAGVWNRSAFWVTSHRALLENILGRRYGVLGRLLAYPLSAGARWRDYAKTATLKRDSRVEECSAFDSRFDEFWDKLRAKYPRVLLADRSREMLDWHFRLALRDGRLWIAILPSGGSIQAYAIFDRNDNHKIGMTRMRLVDFQSLEGDEFLQPLLAWALDRCKREGIHVLESTGRWLEPGGFMQTAAPHRRKLPSWTYFYRAATPELDELLKEPSAWNPSLYDGDASL
jgi:hypothetical protein